MKVIPNESHLQIYWVSGNVIWHPNMHYRVLIKEFALLYWTSGIPGGYRLVSTYDLTHFPKWGGYSRVNFGHLKSGSFPILGGYSGVNFGHLKSEVFWNGGGGYSRVNFGHLKSEVFRNGGGAFWSEIPERGFLENLDKNLLFSQKPACASQIVSHILCGDVETNKNPFTIWRNGIDWPINVWQMNKK